LSDNRPDEPFPLSRLDYHLPEELIAQTPVEPRDAARLLLVDRQTETLQDRRFFELPEILRPDDLLVLNDTRVRPARMLTRRETGGLVELLLLARGTGGSWTALAKPARRLRPGEHLRVVDAGGVETDHVVRFIERQGGQVKVEVDDASIDEYGRVPLPPYIRSTLSEPDRYQTVYAAESGSSAAPTAGLHFTDELLERLAARNIHHAFVTLHIGLDTFRPITAENAIEHEIHSEWYQVPAATREAIQQARSRGGRVVGVGTTVVRTLEMLAASDDESGWADLFIYPPYDFKLVDVMITNFHLPRTTLLLMVAAMMGEDLVWRAYQHAIDQRYRFYSFGDAMIIV
jgi:S-adenosylmethionine:tRNA ribosyltransferase-isomerase